MADEPKARPNILMAIWPAILGWGCLGGAWFVLEVMPARDEEHAYDQIGIALGLLWAGVILGTPLATIVSLALYPPARRPIPIFVNLSPILYCLLFLLIYA